MKHLLKRACFILVAASIFSSCSDIEDFVLDYQYDYYPLEFGRYVIYDVDSFSFDNNFTPSKRDTFHYQKMHRVDSMFIDNIGREAYKIMRYQRTDSSQPWFITDVWYVVRTQTNLEFIEENQRFIKLIFPPVENYAWTGNQYIQIVDGNWYLEDWDYNYESVHSPEDINGFQFDSTLTVKQHDFETLIEKVYAEEKYANNVGMIYKQLIALQKQNITASWNEPDKGFILTMTISDYGPK